MRSLLVTLLMCLLGASVGANEAAPASADPALEARVMQIAAELRCLVCQNQTLADSNASLALDLREQMRVMLSDGADADQVRRFMTDRYGDFVLYRPPLKATTFALWFGPLALLIGGLGVLFVVLRRRSKLGAEHFEPDAAAGHNPDNPDTTDEGVTT
jgi:cytochrome c-type biogenesis protein CcmH